MIKNGFAKLPKGYEYDENLDEKISRTKILVIVAISFAIILLMVLDIIKNNDYVFMFIGVALDVLYQILNVKLKVFNFHEWLHKIGIKITTNADAVIYQNWETKQCRTYLPNGEVINKKASIISLLMPVTTITILFILFSLCMRLFNYYKLLYIVSSIFVLEFSLACGDINSVLKILKKYKNIDILIQFGKTEDKIYIRKEI